MGNLFKHFSHHLPLHIRYSVANFWQFLQTLCKNAPWMLMSLGSLQGSSCVLRFFFLFSGLVQHKGGRRGQKGGEGWSYEVLPLVFTQHILRVGFVVEGEFRTVLWLASLRLLCLKRLFPSVQTPSHDGQRWQDDKYHHGDDTCRQTEDIIIQLYCCILGLTSL